MTYKLNAYTGLPDLTGTGGGGAVSSVSNSDTTLTISPTTGAVVASLNLNKANTWLQDQSVPDEVYGVAWNGSLEVPTKNALYDKIETLTGSSIGGTLTGGTTGSVLFVGTGPVLAQDNANFFWDDTNNILCLGGTSAAAADIALGADGSLVVNEQGNAVNFRVEGDTLSNLIVTNGTNDTVGIGTAASTGDTLLTLRRDQTVTSGSNYAFRSINAANPASASSAVSVGYQSEVYYLSNQNCTGNLQALNFTSYHFGSGTLQTAYGFLGIAYNAGTGIINEAVGGQVQYYSANASGSLFNGVGLSVSAPLLVGAITNSMGIRIKNMGGATVTNSWGLRINAQSGSTTTNLAIITEGGDSQFLAGNVSIRLTATPAAFNVSPASTTSIGSVVRGLAAQTGNLQEWQNSAGTPLAFVASNGDIIVPDEVYGVAWNGSLEVPTKNAIYDKIETVLPDGDKGDITVSGSGATWTIDNDAVTYAKIQNVTTARLLGRATAGSGDVEEITLGTNLSFTGTTLNATGGGGGSFTMTETEIDFGTLPQWDKKFTITDGSVSGSSKITVWPSGNVATDRTGNDYEWDNIHYAASAGTGSFTLMALAFPGPIVGKRKIYYAVA